MSKQDKQRAILQQLSILADQPAEQISYALVLLEQERSIQVVPAALAIVVAANSSMLQAARPILLRLYEYYDTAGIKRDAGGQIRSTILTALLPIAHLADRSLAERAVITYEFMPPNREECAGGLRAAGLSFLAHLDTFQASYHCIRQLNDPYTSRMSGEPAISAIRLLANQGHFLPLYAFVLNNIKMRGNIPEVIAECFKFLTEVPSLIVDDLLSQYMAYFPGTMTPIYELKDDIELAGFFDLLLIHADRNSCLNFITQFLRETVRYEIYRYLVNIIMIQHQSEAWKHLLKVASTERDQHKIDILLTAFDLMQSDPHVIELITILQKKR